MEYFIKLVELGNYKQRRQKQLKEEESNHKKLENYKKECPSIIVNILLWRSMINRRQFNETCEASIFSVASTTDKHMEWIDNYHLTLKAILDDSSTPHMVCERLEKFINHG